MRIGLIILLLIFIFSPVYAQDISEWHPMDDLTLKMAVFGPYDEIFIWWGHAALIVENTRWGFLRVFDWGIFSYPSDNFLKDFIRGQVRYRSASGSLNLAEYINEDRDIVLYTLNLDRKGKETILAYAENSVLPENRYYDYHEFRDNCATRIRDIIDMGTGGQFKAAFDNVPGRFSIRQHVTRFTWARPFSNWFLGFMMGQDLDRKITVWDEMFLPVEIARNIVDFTYTDNSGVERKLVSSVQVVNSSNNRQPILTTPLTTWPFALAAGVIFAFLLFRIKHLSKMHPRAGRITWGMTQSLLGLFFGGIGCVLVFGAFVMDNDYFQQNFNLLFVNPLLLVIFPLGILSALNKALRINPARCLHILWTSVFIAGSVTVLIRILPFFFQQNQSVQGIVLPIAFVFSCIPDNLYKLKSLVRKLR